MIWQKVDSMWFPLCFQCRRQGLPAMTKEHALKMTIERAGWVELDNHLAFCPGCKDEFLPLKQPS